MRYKFRFYKKHTNLILSFHHAKLSTTLLDGINDCKIDAYGDIPVDPISKYDMYFYAGVFYNVVALLAGMRFSHRKGARLI